MTNMFVAAHALIRRESTYLVTRRSSQNDYLPLKWDVPGGTVEAGESAEEALAREVREETTLTVSIIAPIFVYTNRDQFPLRQTFQIVFLCNYVSGNVNLNPEEHDQFAWLAWDEIHNLDFIPFAGALVKHISDLDKWRESLR